jgi:hypothetical protein
VRTAAASDEPCHVVFLETSTDRHVVPSYCTHCHSNAMQKCAVSTHLSKINGFLFVVSPLF